MFMKLCKILAVVMLRISSKVLPAAREMAITMSVKLGKVAPNVARGSETARTGKQR